LTLTGSSKIVDKANAGVRICEKPKIDSIRCIDVLYCEITLHHAKMLKDFQTSSRAKNNLFQVESLDPWVDLTGWTCARNRIYFIALGDLA